MLLDQLQIEKCTHDDSKVQSLKPEEIRIHMKPINCICIAWNFEIRLNGEESRNKNHRVNKSA